MSTEIETPAVTIGAEVTLCEEVPMVRQERWEELRRLWQQDRVPVAELARRFELDRKTVRRCLRDPAPHAHRHPGVPVCHRCRGSGLVRSFETASARRSPRARRSTRSSG